MIPKTCPKSINLDIPKINFLNLTLTRIFYLLISLSQPFEFSIPKDSTFIIVFSLHPSNVMNITQKYATAASGVFFISVGTIVRVIMST
jgi:hypothetical protein